MSASQESDAEGERGGRGRQLSKAVLECSFRSEITHSDLDTKGRCTGTERERRPGLK